MRRLAAIDRSRNASFSATNNHPDRLRRAFSLVIDWAAAASGHMHLDDVLLDTARLAGGTHLSVYRISAKDFAPQLMAQIDRREVKVPTERNTGALMQFAIENFPEQVVAGKIFNLTTLRADSRFPGTSADKQWSAQYDFANVRLMILAKNALSWDVLEIRYSTPPEVDDDIPIAVIGAAIADAWRLRSPGFVLGLISKFGTRHRKVGGAVQGHLFGPDNPYALSPSQLRVCQLLAAGQKAAEIADFMNISITTVRSHLRNIYAKTNTSGRFDIISLINGTGSYPSVGESTPL